MLKKSCVSWFLCLSLVFVSAFFVGCKPHEEPIALEDITLGTTKKVIEKAKRNEKSEEPVFEKAKNVAEIKPENDKNKIKREVIVNVTALGTPLAGATVTLVSQTSAGNVVVEKQTDESGRAKFSLIQFLHFFNITAYSEEYAAENKMVTGNVPKNKSAVIVNLDLKDKGVVITACLEHAPDEISDFTARIEQSENQTGYPKIFIVTTNIVENQVTFPPIASGLKKLRVCVDGENIPNCYSESFDTTDCVDKDIFVDIPINVTLNGTARTPSGLTFTNSFLAMVIPDDLSKGVHRTGLIYNKQIHPDSYGSYELTGLAEGNFDIMFAVSGSQPFKTNLHLKSPATTLDFSFSRIAASSFGGIVINSLDNQPMEGITVKTHSWRDQPAYASCVTDASGKFSLELKENHPGFFGEIVVDEPGYGKIIKQMRKENKYVKIFLSQGGNVKGTVMTKSGTTIPGETVRMEIIEKGEPGKTKKVYYSSDNHVSYQAITDSDGNFEFQNVVAPAKYGFDIYGIHNSGYSLPSYRAANGPGFTVEVEPDKTSKCDLIVQKPGTVALKGQDENGNPILKYEFNYRLRYGTYSSEHQQVNVLENEWHYLDLLSVGKQLFSCNAKESSGNKNPLIVATNNIAVYDGETNYIILIFSQSKPNLTGHLFAPDGSVAKDIRVRAWVSGKGGPIAEKVNNEGYFELQGLDLKEGEMMNVEANSWKDKSHVYTNLPSGAKDVKLQLKLPFKIVGRVFLDNLDTPAKNFTIGQKYNKQSYNTDDGSFVFIMQRRRKGNGNQGSIKVSIDNYLPLDVEYKFTTNSVCDVGNIILKSGN